MLDKQEEKQKFCLSCEYLEFSSWPSIDFLKAHTTLLLLFLPISMIHKSPESLKTSWVNSHYTKLHSQKIEWGGGEESALNLYQISFYLLKFFLLI